MQGDLKVVYAAASEIEAVLYRSLLEEAGIDVEERPCETIVFESVKQNALHSQLLVRPEDETRARELIRAFTEEADRGTLAVDEEEESTGD